MSETHSLGIGANVALPSIIFVTGASRSGTTMLSRILANHSAILGLNELHFFGDLFDVAKSATPAKAHELEHMAAAIIARQSRGIWGSGPTPAERLRAKSICEALPVPRRNGFGVFAAVLRALSQESRKLMACEQTPRNVFYAEHILGAFQDARVIHIVRDLGAFQDARVIHIVRDPRAVLASQKNRWKLRHLGARNVPWTELLRTWVNYHPITASKLWASATARALRLVGHPRFMLTRFEDVLSDPQRQVTEICKFLGIDFESPMLEVNQWGSSNLQHELHKKGISKEVMSQWETSLTAGELAISEHMSQELMQRLNYQATLGGSVPALQALPHLLTYPVHLLGIMLANPRRAWIQLQATLQTAAKTPHSE
jgi:omega-hydroxy-beta-dihydromenaquinone-9 sulfotransferase